MMYDKGTSFMGGIINNGKTCHFDKKKVKEKLEKELQELKTVRRKEVADRIKQAIDFGDISENSEYDDAKNEQAFIEGRIQRT